MAKVPVTQGNAVSLNPMSSARFRAADTNGGVGAALGKGLQQLGATVEDWSDKLAKTSADDLLLQYQQGARTIKSQFGALQGKDALTARPLTEESLTTLREDILGKADRVVAGMLRPRLEQFHSVIVSDIDERSQQAQYKYDVTVNAAQTSNAAELASDNYDKPELRSQFLAQGRAYVREGLRLAGLDGDPDIVKNKETEWASGVYYNTLSQLNSQGRYKDAAAYFAANRGEMNAAHELSIANALKGPLDREWAEEKFLALTALPTISEPGKANPLTGGKTNPVEDGGAAIRALFPKANITSTYRPSDHPLSKANPRSWHTQSHAAVDIKPIPGMDFTDYVAGIEAAGYKVIEAKNEVGAGRSAHATGDHWHIVLGKGGGAAAGATAAPSARRWDLEDVTTKIYAEAAKQGWTLEQRDLVLDAAKKRIGTDETLIARREADADRAAGEFVLGKGDAFTDVGQIPRSVWGGLSVADRDRYTDLAKRNRAPVEPKANGELATSLEIERIRNPEAFASMNLSTLRGKVTDAEFQGLLVEQERIKKGDPDADLRPKVAATINTYDTPDLGLGNKDTGAAKRVRIQKIMESELRAVTGGKRKPTEGELYQAFLSATKEVAIPYVGTFGSRYDKSVRRFDIEADNIPADVRWQINDASKRKRGRPASDEEAAQAYREMKGRY